jgi:hypothetical protein
MPQNPPKPGDVMAGVVTAVKPFGVSVDAAGIPGLVRGASALVGESVPIRVVEVAEMASRFSAVIA